MTTGSEKDKAPSSRKASVQAGLVQVTGVGMGLLGALFMAAIVFLATGRGSEAEALGIFPAWGLIFVALIWRASGWRQTMARGLTLLGAESLALPLTWLLYQGLPSLSGSDPRVPQTLAVVALGLTTAAALLAAGYPLWRSEGRRGPGRPGVAILALGIAVFLGEALYGLLLLLAPRLIP